MTSLFSRENWYIIDSFMIKDLAYLGSKLFTLYMFRIRLCPVWRSPWMETLSPTLAALLVGILNLYIIRSTIKQCFFLNSPSFPAYLKININFHLKTFLLQLQFCFSNYHVFISQVSWRLNTSMIVLCLPRIWTWPLTPPSTWTPLSATVPGRSDTPPHSILPSRPSPRTTLLLGTLPRRQFFTALATTER